MTKTDRNLNTKHSGEGCNNTNTKHIYIKGPIFSLIIQNTEERNLFKKVQIQEIHGCIKVPVF